MNAHRTIIVTTLLAVLGTGIVVASFLLFGVYQGALKEKHAQLQDLATTRAALIEASVEAGRSSVAELAPIVAAGFGSTGEFVIYERVDGAAHVMVEPRLALGVTPEPVADDHPRAQPIQRALDGRSRPGMATDYRGERVVSAFARVPSLDWGVEAKLDLAEVRRPYVAAGFRAAVVLLVIAAFVLLIASRHTEPVIADLVLKEERLRALIEAAPTPVIVVSREGGGILFANGRARQMFGEGDSVASHVTFDDFLAAPNFGRLLTLVDATGELNDHEVRVKYADGSKHWVLVSVRQAEAAGQGVLFISCVDLDAQKIHEAELHSARAEAEAAARAKSSFLATMSHEIRTPMNGVLGIAELLLRTELSDDQRHDLEILHRSGRNLLTILNDILDYSKIEAGEMVLSPEPTNVARLLQETVDIFRPVATDRGIALPIDVRVLPHLQIDPLRLRQVVLNLVGNALKFTPEGSVTVRAIPVRHGEHRVTMRVEVIDTGVGIDPAKLDTLFDEFTQADTSHTRRAGGTGLGLGISARLVALMGGRLTVESALGVGSTFRFEIEAEVAEVPAAASNRPPEEDSVWNARILVVEDNRINQLVARKMLERFGVTVEVVDNGVKAVEAVARESWDLIFMDCQMPEMDGYDATRRIRRLEGDGPRTPILAMTAATLPEERDLCRAAGMDDFVPKPVELKVLRAKLAAWLPRARSARVA